MNPVKTCPECGDELGEDGLCAVCLMAGGLGPLSSTAEAETVAMPNQDGTATVATALEYDHFGNYEIIRLLGEGGMGAVYLAQQTAPIQRQVALKVVKPGMDTSQILARFNYERQTLASMDHPNIAHVFDASTTQKGRPYFVMEYIDGEAITTYCDRQRMTTRERLQLFLPVCQALQHAHQKGIIHRDIKPSNVLVTEIDGKPVPKVIDFGIAKATEQRNFEQTAFTQFGQFVGTPEYMSPEAADVMNGDVDTASDVYSLGVLLYELLIGAVPFDGKTLRKAGLAELMRIVREVEAPPMTVKLTQMGETGLKVAEQRRTDLQSLKRAVKGDLNWIVTKAVEKTRQRRYPSASELLADIDRHLNDLPVEASPPSKMYRASKFVRRNRAMVIGSTAVAAALVFGIIGTIWQAREAERGRAEALLQKTEALHQKGTAEQALTLAETRRLETEQQRLKAEQSAQRALQQEARAKQGEALAQTNLAEARTLANSMLFELNDKVKDLGGSMPAQEALVRLGTQSLRKSAQSDPMLGAAYFRLGELQGKQGLWDVEAARQSYRQSVQLLEQKWASGADRETGRQLALAYARQGSLEDDEKPQAEAYQRAEKLLTDLLARTPADPALLRTAAEVQVARKEPAKALEYVAKLKVNGLADRALRASAQQAMAEKVKDEDMAEALDWSLKSLQLMDGVVKDAPQNATFRMQQADSLRVSAELLAELNRYNEAFANARRAVAIGQELAAMDPNQSNFQWLQAQAELQLGQLHSQTGEREAAQRLLDTASQRMASQVARYPQAVYLAVKYAEVMERVARNDLSTSEFSALGTRSLKVLEALKRAEQVSPESRIVQRWKVLTSFSMADGLARSGESAGAMKIVMEALATAERLQTNPSPEDRLVLAEATFMRGYVLRGMRRFSEAIPEIEKAAAALDVLRQKAPSDEIKAMWMMCNMELFSNHYLNRDYRAAVRAGNRILPVAEADHNAKPKSYSALNWLSGALSALRASYGALGEEELGLAGARKSLEISKRYQLAHPTELRAIQQIQSSYVNLTGDLIGAVRRDEAIVVTKEGLRFIEGSYPRVQSAEAKTRVVEGWLYFVRFLSLSLDQPEEAVPNGQTAIAWVEALAKEDPQNRAKMNMLQTAYRDTSTASLNSGNLELAIAYQRKALELQRDRAGNTPGDWMGIAGSESVVASFADRMKPGSGREGWRNAIESYEKARTLAERTFQADARNLAALNQIFVSEHSIASLHEYLGDLAAADKWSESALRRIEMLGKANPNDKANQDQLTSMRGRAVRARWRLQGGQAQYSSLLDGAEVTPERIDEELATGHFNSMNYMAMQGYDQKARVPEVERAVELSRGLLRKGSNPARRLLLARSLDAFGVCLWILARFTPNERSALLRRGLDATRESLDLYSALQSEKVSTEEVAAYARSARLRVANIQARLAQVSPAVSSRQ